jgi:predicted small integral membrane protein
MPAPSFSPRLPRGPSLAQSGNAGAQSGAVIFWNAAQCAVGEWFAMWQSQVWNGQQPAFRILVSILLVLIFVAQPDAEL